MPPRSENFHPIYLPKTDIFLAWGHREGFKELNRLLLSSLRRICKSTFIQQYEWASGRLRVALRSAKSRCPVRPVAARLCLPCPVKGPGGEGWLASTESEHHSRRTPGNRSRALRNAWMSCFPEPQCRLSSRCAAPRSLFYFNKFFENLVGRWKVLDQRRCPPFCIHHPYNSHPNFFNYTVSFSNKTPFKVFYRHREL